MGCCESLTSSTEDAATQRRPPRGAKRKRRRIATKARAVARTVAYIVPNHNPLNRGIGAVESAAAALPEQLLLVTTEVGLSDCPEFCRDAPSLRSVIAAAPRLVVARWGIASPSGAALSLEGRTRLAPLREWLDLVGRVVPAVPSLLPPSEEGGWGRRLTITALEANQRTLFMVAARCRPQGASRDGKLMGSSSDRSSETSSLRSRGASKTSVATALGREDASEAELYAELEQQRSATEAAGDSD